MLELWRHHREALEADWLRVWGKPWVPATGDRPGNYGLAQAWRMTRTILMRHDSYSWAALAGWWYVPSPPEEIAWAQAAAEDRISGHSADWRPWSDSTGDPFKPTADLKQVHAAKAATRAKLRERFHITEE